MWRAAALHKLPEAKVTEGVSIDDFSTWRADPEGWLFTRERGWMGLVVGLLRAGGTGRKGTFRSYQPPEPQQRRCGVTRRAAKRRRCLAP